MEAVDPLSQGHQAITEDSSDRSDESSTMSQDYHSRGFEDYDIVKRVNESVGERSSGMNNSPNVARDFRLSVGRNTDSDEQPHNNPAQFDGVLGNECSLHLGKLKKYDFASVHLNDGLNYQTERMHGAELATEGLQVCRSKDSTMKEAFLSLQSARDKYLATNLERLPKELNYLVEREIKEYGIAKGYNLTLDRMKEFKLPHERARESQPNVLPARERLNDVGLIDANDHRDLHGQTRTPQDLECIVYEHMRRSHHHVLNRMDLSGQHLTSSPHVRQASVTQLQQSQQQQQQQIKSFTIDAILAHRNNQNRERYQRNQQQQLKKATRAVRQECQEVTEKKSGLCTGRVPDTNVNEVSLVVNSGKAKRVRTIFTAEQLERLEGEFARQQYMVGPERLYLAHALRLTEAQVKVWFQNRRIKWRKVNHEQQCQAVSEHRQRCSLPGTLEIHEDESSDTNNVNWCVNSTIAPNNSGDEASLINASNQQHRDIRDSSILKS